MPYDPDDEKEQTLSRRLSNFASYNLASGICAAGAIMASPGLFTDFSGTTIRPPSSSAPKWRYYEPGLNIEGKFRNFLNATRKFESYPILLILS